MKTPLFMAIAFLFVGCASNPVLTGKPQDWKGKSASDLEAAWGEPTRVISQSDGTEVWEYVKTGEFVAPENERTSFNVGGGGGSTFFGASGGINTTEQGQRLSQYENIFRFQINNGKVRKWFAARIVDGQTVWSDK